jgi:hypothetical protein
MSQYYFYQHSDGTERAYDPIDPTPDKPEWDNVPRLMLYHNDFHGPVVFWNTTEMRSGWVIGVGVRNS